MTNQKYPSFLQNQPVLEFFCEVIHIIMKQCITIPEEPSSEFHMCGYLPLKSSFVCRKFFQNLHIAQIKNLCPSLAVLLSADQ